MSNELAIGLVAVGVTFLVMMGIVWFRSRKPKTWLLREAEVHKTEPIRWLGGAIWMQIRLRVTEKQVSHPFGAGGSAIIRVDEDGYVVEKDFSGLARTIDGMFDRESGLFTFRLSAEQRNVVEVIDEMMFCSSSVTLLVSDAGNEVCKINPILRRGAIIDVGEHRWYSDTEKSIPGVFVGCEFGKREVLFRPAISTEVMTLTAEMPVSDHNYPQLNSHVWLTIIGGTHIKGVIA